MFVVVNIWSAGVGGRLEQCVSRCVELLDLKNSAEMKILAKKEFNDN